MLAARKGCSGGMVGQSQGTGGKRTQSQIALGGPRAPSAKGFVLGGSRGMIFARRSTLPCLVLADAQ